MTLAKNVSLLGDSTAVASELKLISGVLRTSARDGDGVLVFRGIPYAAPPVGDLRWRSPQPALAWKGVRDATEFGLRCWAPAFRGPVQLSTPASEDCLTLNVWTAAESSGDKCPVMVWFHGGGFQFGASGEPATDGARLASRGVVVVSANYRLGVFGFLAHPELDDEGAPSGNVGLQDQIAALQWVHANIAHFGGDPGNVTLFGQSAGAMSAGLLMTSPLATGLFHRAIGQSGAFWDSDEGSLATHTEALARGQTLAEQLGNGSIASLRALSTEELGERTAWGLDLDPVTAAFSPSVDGYVLPEAPAYTFAKGCPSDIPLLAGWNEEEGFIFLRRTLPHSTLEEFESDARERFGTTRLAEFSEAYPAKSESALKQAAMDLMGDMVISEQVWEWLQLKQQTGKAPVYGYQYNYHSAYAPVAAHSVEVPFVFGTLIPQRLAPETPAPGPRDRELSNEMMSYWINFARSGDPNGLGLPVWPAYETTASRVMVFDSVTEAQDESGTARFRFLRSFRTNGRFPAAWRRGGALSKPAA